MMSKQLQLRLESDFGKATTLSIENPAEPVDETAVEALMDTIIAKEAFFTSDGIVTKKVYARVVERNVDTIWETN